MARLTLEALLSKFFCTGNLLNSDWPSKAGRSTLLKERGDLLEVIGYGL
jgi:hypothetical protein